MGGAPCCMADDPWGDSMAPALRECLGTPISFTDPEGLGQIGDVGDRSGGSDGPVCLTLDGNARDGAVVAPFLYRASEEPGSRFTVNDAR